MNGAIENLISVLKVFVGETKCTSLIKQFKLGKDFDMIAMYFEEKQYLNLFRISK